MAALAVGMEAGMAGTVRLQYITAVALAEAGLRCIMAAALAPQCIMAALAAAAPQSTM